MKFFQGLVVSLKNRNTAVVEVSTLKTHEKYKKVVKSVRNFQVHYRDGVELQIGQKVTIVPSRPFSATKRFSIVEENIS